MPYRNILGNTNCGFICPAACYVANGVSAASNDERWDVETAHEGNAGRMPCQAQTQK